MHALTPGGRTVLCCAQGYFGTTVGATGVCTQCPADTFRSTADSPVECRACPETSHTFTLGATSDAECLCSAGTFNDRSGVNGTFSCAPAPTGGWAPDADSRLFTLEGYWRPDANHTEFFPCASGNCLREQPPADGEPQQGYACRDGHQGHLCAVCIRDYAYQGTYCTQCDASSIFREWSLAKKSGLIFTGLLLFLVSGFLFFGLPLCPGIEAWLKRLWQPAVDRAEAALESLVHTARPASAGVGLNGTLRPGSAARRPGSSGRPRSAAQFDAAKAASPQVRRRIKRGSRLDALFDVLAEPIRIIVSFWQVVSSFNNNLAVPWPSLYYALANALTVVSLQLLHLPNIACIQPEVSWYIVFNGVTLSCFVFVVFVGGMYYWGPRTAALVNDAGRRRRFKTRCLNICAPRATRRGARVSACVPAATRPDALRLVALPFMRAVIWAIFLVYPQVSSTTLLVFSCVRLEDGTEWLSADYRIQCWTPRHKLHVGVGVLWTLCFPFGIPFALLYFLRWSQVPVLAAWKRDSAWLRAIVQRSMQMRVRLPQGVDPDTLTTDSIDLEHLRTLHMLFVMNATPGAEAPAAEEAAAAFVGQGALVAVAPEELVVQHAPPVQRAGAVGLAVQHAPPLQRVAPGQPWPQAVTEEHSTRGGRSRSSARSGVSRARSHRSRSMSRPPTEAPLPEGVLARLWARMQRVKQRVARVTHSQTSRLRRSVSQILWTDERQLLLDQLLSWAKFDPSSLISEPRHNQLHWRTRYEWDALTEEGARLGARDTIERSAFFKFRVRPARTARASAHRR